MYYLDTSCSQILRTDTDFDFVQYDLDWMIPNLVESHDMHTLVMDIGQLYDPSYIFKLAAKVCMDTNFYSVHCDLDI